jgi:hypothetical protein
LTLGTETEEARGILDPNVLTRVWNHVLPAEVHFTTKHVPAVALGNYDKNRMRR